MTDQTGAPPHDDSASAGHPGPTVPAPPTYAPPAHIAPTYTPPAYPGSPYGAPTPGAPAYGAPRYGAPAYGAPAYGAPAPGGYPNAAYAPARPTNGLAVAAMILSILGAIMVLPIVGSLAGAIMGHASLSQITRSRQAGRGMALTGVILGWVGLAFFVLIVVFFSIAFATAQARYSYGA